MSSPFAWTRWQHCEWFHCLIPTPTNGHIESDARSDDWNSYRLAQMFQKPGSWVKLCSIFFWSWTIKEEMRGSYPLLHFRHVSRHLLQVVRAGILRNVLLWLVLGLEAANQLWQVIFECWWRWEKAIRKESKIFTICSGMYPKIFLREIYSLQKYEECSARFSFYWNKEKGP